MKSAGRIGLAVAGAASAAVMIRFSARFFEKCPCSELHRLIQTLPQCHGMADTLAAIERSFITAFRLPVAILLPEAGAICVKHHSPGFIADMGDLNAAASAILSGCTVRRMGVEGSECSYFLPLATWKGAIGAFAFKTTPNRLSPEQWRTIRSFANQTSLAVLRTTFEYQARDADVLSEAERLQKALLNSVAHNVRTPLASVIGALSTLQEEQCLLNAAVRRELIDTARCEAERLNRLLGNLVDMSRLEAGALRVRTDPCDVQDVIGAALEQLGAAARNRPINVNIAPDLPLVHMDFVLIVQVLVNVLDNAIKYAPQDGPITIEARQHGGTLEICTSDEGDGIAEHELGNVFEKFNRAGRTGETGGIGLGLSICRGLIEAHKGAIWAERRKPRGTTITFRVPLRQVDQERMRI